MLVDKQSLQAHQHYVLGIVDCLPRRKKKLLLHILIIKGTSKSVYPTHERIKYARGVTVMLLRSNCKHMTHSHVKHLLFD